MNKNIMSISRVELSLKSLLSALRVDEEDEMIEDIEEMRREAMTIARPIALYWPFAPEVGEGAIRLNGVAFEEPFVRKMLGSAETVVPYVASCGREIEEWSQSITDLYKQYVADIIKQMCLGVIREKMLGQVKEKYFNTEKNISSINPGSLTEWPIASQRPLFAALGGVTGDIGVVLSDSFLMWPIKSVSGILFQTEEAYENCQLCPRINCPGRRAPYAGD